MKNAIQRRAVPTIESITIYSPVRSIDNILLTETLADSLALPCRISVTPSQQPPSDLLLFDCRETSIQQAMHWLNYLQERQRSRVCVLINVTSNTAHERLIEWPQIQGIFYNKQCHKELREGLLKILKGELCLPIHLCHEFLLHRRKAPLAIAQIENPQLTRREWQIMEGLYAGYSNTKIADTLALSQHTVKSHLYNAYKKLGVCSRLQACAWMRDNSSLDTELQR